MEADSRRMIIAKYRYDVEDLAKYIPWLESKREQSLMTDFNRSGATQTSLSFPIYDGTLMNFVKSVQNSIFLNKNYRYVLIKYNVRTVKDEEKALEEAALRDMDLIGAILSKYILGGMTKAVVWPEGVRNGIYYKALTTALRLIQQS